MMMMIDVLRPLLCTRQDKWAGRLPKVMRRSERRNNLQICPRRYSNTGGSDLWSSTLPLDHGGAPDVLEERTRKSSILNRYNLLVNICSHRTTITNTQNSETINNDNYTINNKINNINDINNKQSSQRPNPVSPLNELWIISFVNQSEKLGLIQSTKGPKFELID